jgi:hypothetical protein
MEPETPKPRLIGNSTVRLVIGALLLLVIFVVLVFTAVNVLRSSRNGPLPVDIYPGAQTIKNVRTDKTQSALYSTTDSVQQVFDFYNGRLPKDEDIEGCKKIYTDAIPSEDPGHFYARCIVDNSQLDITQELMITVNFQLNPTTNTNQTVILIEQQWGN